VRLAVALSLTVTLALAAVSVSSAGSTANCRILRDSTARLATDQEAVLNSEHSAGDGKIECAFHTGVKEPEALPPEVRTRATLELRLFLLSRGNLKSLASQQCALANKGYYPKEVCTFARRAADPDVKDPLRRFQLWFRSQEEMGSARKTGGFGNPTFITQLSPPLVGTELWVYIEEKKKVLVVSCVDLTTARVPPKNGHFRSCAVAAAHAALIQLS
jgi:hypothetical protein